MTAFEDVSVIDLIGASAQWEDYIKNDLGFDYSVVVELGVRNGKGRLWLTGNDAFQKNAEYDRRIGQLTHLDNFPLDEAWAVTQTRTWEYLKKVMPRDEREMRHGLAAMSGIIEHAPSYQSAVGKMLADRVVKLRDEVNENLIEYRRPAAE